MSQNGCDSRMVVAAQVGEPLVVQVVVEFDPDTATSAFGVDTDATTVRLGDASEGMWAVGHRGTS